MVMAEHLRQVEAVKCLVGWFRPRSAFPPMGGERRIGLGKWNGSSRIMRRIGTDCDGSAIRGGADFESAIRASRALQCPNLEGRWQVAVGLPDGLVEGSVSERHARGPQHCFDLAEGEVGVFG